jgi:hypothetical protein
MRYFLLQNALEKAAMVQAFAQVLDIHLGMLIFGGMMKLVFRSLHWWLLTLPLEIVAGAITSIFAGVEEQRGELPHVDRKLDYMLVIIIWLI